MRVAWACRNLSPARSLRWLSRNPTASFQFPAYEGTPRVLTGGFTMARTKQVSKRKRRRVGLPALGAGMSLMMAGGAAANAPTTNAPSLQDIPAITLDEEEIADVSLGTFYVFDKENESQLGQGIRLAARCGGRCGGGGVARCGGGGRCAAVARCAARCASTCAVARCAAGRCAVARCGRCAGGCGCGGCGGCGGWWGIAPAVGVGVVGAGCWRWTAAGWVWVCY